MIFVLRSYVLYSLFSVVYSRPTITEDEDDYQNKINCGYYDNITKTTPKKYCGSELANRLSLICLDYNFETDGDGSDVDGVNKCCADVCSLDYLVKFCKCINVTALNNIIKRETPATTTTIEPIIISNEISKDTSTNRKVRHLILRYLNCKRSKRKKKNNNANNSNNNNKRRKNNKVLQRIKKLTSTPLESSSALTNFLLNVLIDGKKFTCKKYFMMKRKIEYPRRAPVLGIDDTSTNNYSHINPNVNINY